MTDETFFMSENNKRREVVPCMHRQPYPFIDTLVLRPASTFARQMGEVARQEDVEGETEGDDEDGEDDENLDERLENLEEHHHVDPEHIEPADIPLCQWTSFCDCLCVYPSGNRVKASVHVGLFLNNVASRNKPQGLHGQSKIVMSAPKHF